MSKSDVKGVQATKIHDDGTAPVLQVDSFGGVMFNGKSRGELLKFNLCQDLPIMTDANRGGFSHIQKRVIARLVMTPSALKDLSEMLNDVLKYISDTENSEG